MLLVFEIELFYETKINVFPQMQCALYMTICVGKFKSKFDSAWKNFTLNSPWLSLDCLSNSDFISETQFESGVSIKPWMINLVNRSDRKFEFLIESLSSATSSWPSVGLFSVYRIKRVLITFRGKGKTLNGRWIKWYQSRVIFKQPISPKQRVSFSTEILN